MRDEDEAITDDRGPHGHAPVLLREVLEILRPAPGESAVDCTAGRGGHAVALATAVGPTGRLAILDVDQGNLAYASARVSEEAGFAPYAVHANFAGVARALKGIGGTPGFSADVVLADLGFSSTQMFDPARGFSFAQDGPLDMRLDPTSGTTAAMLLRSLPERELADILFKLGEEPLARVIARKIVAVRGREPMESTAQLARLVREAYGPRARRSRLHPATRTFMALRIAVNDELGALRSLLEAVQSAAHSVADGATSWLRAHARVGIITFHSLEDRLVKHSFAELVRARVAAPLTRKPVVASDGEIAANPKARSAKFRVIQIATVGGLTTPEIGFESEV